MPKEPSPAEIEWNISKAEVSEAIRMLTPSDSNLRMMLAISVMSLYKQGRSRKDLHWFVDDVINGSVT